jgi:integrase
MMAGTLQSIIRSIRNGYMAELTETQINDLIKKHIKTALQADERERIMDDTPFDPSYYNNHQKILGMAQDLLQDRLRVKDSSFITETVDKLLKVEDIQSDVTSLPYRMLCREMFKAEGHILEIQRKREQGDYSDEISPVLPQGQTEEQGTQEATKVSKTISQVMDDFFEEGDAEERWKGKTKLEVRASMQILIDYFGDVSIDSINRKMMGQFKRDLMKLPPNMNKDKQYRDLNIHEIIALKPERTIKALTISKYLSRANTLFDYARINGEIILNPVEGMTISKNKRADERKTIYDTEELKRIFGSDKYMNDKFSRSYMYWTPILAIFTGARQEEISSLRLKDFEEHEGIWCLNIIADDGKDLKNKQSRRLIPLHPFLVDDLGIIRRVNDLKARGKKNFLPDLSPHGGRYGVYVSRWYNERFKKSLGFPTGEGKDFHSFRHTFGTNLAHNEINDHSLKSLMGHAEDSITFSTYVKRGAPTKLYNALVKHLDYGINLDRLKDSKWTI